MSTIPWQHTFVMRGSSLWVQRTETVQEMDAVSLALGVKGLLFAQVSEKEFENCSAYSSPLQVHAEYLPCVYFA